MRTMFWFGVSLIIIGVLSLLLPVTAHPLPPGIDPLPTDEPCPAGLCAENPYTPTPDCDSYPFLCGIATVTPTNEPCPIGLCDEYQQPAQQKHIIPFSVFAYDAPDGSIITVNGLPVIVYAGEYTVTDTSGDWVEIFTGVPVWVRR